MSETGNLPDKLTNDDPKFWTPLPFVVEYVERQIPKHGMVLEIGSGINNFERANISIDLVQSKNVPPERMVLCDVETEGLPFPDKRFDFVYCRHVLEDMYNPFFVLSEMSRVAKAGYIETPSPAAEMCRGIDVASKQYRGYGHHRWVIWNENGGLVIMTKFAMIEYAPIADEVLIKNLRGQPNFWNTHYLWNDEIKFSNIQHEPGYGTEHYPFYLERAVRGSVEASIAFYQAMDKERESLNEP